MTDLVTAHPAPGAIPIMPSWLPRLAKFIPSFGIVPRVTLVGVLTVFAAVAMSIWTSVKITEAEMYRRAQSELSINIKLLDSILAGYGAPSRQADKLYFGTTLINGDFEPVDRVKAIAGGTATVFVGDLRVATNVQKPDGSRAVGTRLAAGPAYDSVFGQRRTYRGEANILGEPYLTIYEPIQSGGDVIGIAYVGIKKAEFFSVLQSLVTMNAVAGGGAILLAGLVMYFLVRRIFRPIGAIRRELVDMADATSQHELDGANSAKPPKRARLPSRKPPSSGRRRATRSAACVPRSTIPNAGWTKNAPATRNSRPTWSAHSPAVSPNCPKAT
jgi:methyl-accepting chemotaxis protein